MRKYVKPEIEFQDLALNSDLCSSCIMEMTFAEFSCPILIPEWGETIFTMDNCDIAGDGVDGSEICYHIPTLDGNVFGS